jgi:hypothetical protein
MCGVRRDASSLFWCVTTSDQRTLHPHPYFSLETGALSPHLRMIRRKINRLNVAEFRQKSTKGRK